MRNFHLEINCRVNKGWFPKCKFTLLLFSVKNAIKTSAQSHTGLCSSAVGKQLRQNPAESLQHAVETVVEHRSECIW